MADPRTNNHAAAGHTPDNQRHSRDFHANYHEGARHTPENESLYRDFHANAILAF